MSSEPRLSYVFSIAVHAAALLGLLVLLLLLVLLWDDVVQEAQVMLREHVVHGLPDSHQGQNLRGAVMEQSETYHKHITFQNKSNTILFCSRAISCSHADLVSYHHRENDGRHGGLEDPEQRQT